MGLEMEMEEGGGDGLQTLLVYLQVRKSRVPDEEHFEHTWYMIDESMSCILEETRLSDKSPRDAISAYYDAIDDDPTDPSGGRTLFLCGGRSFHTDTDWNYHGSHWERDNPMSSEFWYLDMVPTSSCDYNVGKYIWTKGPSMILRRASGDACAIAVNKKLYVFGGVHRLPATSPCSWAEVYNINHRYWSPLAPPSNFGPMPQVSACFFVLLDMVDYNENTRKKTDIKRKSILVYFHIIGCIFALLLDFNEWIMVDPSFGKSFENLVFLPDINILLATKDSVLYGYDLLDQEWFKDPVKDSDGNQLLLPMQGQPHSFHLVPLNSSQGNLCMLSAFRCDKLSPLQVSCTKFTVHRIDSSLVATIESTKNFNIVDAEALVCCLPGTIGRKLQGPSDIVEEDTFMDCDFGDLENLKLDNCEEESGEW